MLIWVVVLLLGGYGLWVLTGVLEGYLDVKSRPREPMEWCHRHGYFRRAHVIQFMDTTVCPRCYREAWVKADKK